MIELITTDDLIKELLGRHDHAVFMGVKTPTDNDLVSVRRWRGNSFTCSGMCDSMIKTILDEYKEKEQPIDKEEF